MKVDLLLIVWKGIDFILFDYMCIFFFYVYIYIREGGSL